LRIFNGAVSLIGCGSRCACCDDHDSLAQLRGGGSLQKSRKCYGTWFTGKAGTSWRLTERASRRQPGQLFRGEGYMKNSAVYADFEIISETTQEGCAAGCVWVDTLARPAVSGETVYACVEPFTGSGRSDVMERIALDQALDRARDSLRRRLSGR
jgi:hypothetical protein